MGRDSNVRQRLIGINMTQQISAEAGIDYTVIRVDDGHENTEFIDLIDKIDANSIDRKAKFNGNNLIEFDIF